MIKKLLLILALTLSAAAAKAQLSVGSWALYSPFTQAQQIIETPQRAYFLSDGGLFYVDKETSEQGTLNSTSGLNDVDITGVFYNPYGRYILLTYASGNMDKVFDSGRVVNVSDIKDAVSTDTRDIREVAFGKDFFAVLTSFGLVLYNEATSTVRETIYDPEGAMRHIAAVGKYLILNHNELIKAADATKRLTKVDQFKDIHNLTDQWPKGAMKASGNGVLLMGKEQNRMQLAVIDFDFGGSGLYNAVFNEVVEFDTPKGVEYDRDGLLRLYGATCLFSFDADGRYTRQAYPSQIHNTLCSAYDGLGRVWASLPAGIAQYDITSATPVEIRAPFSPSDLKVRQVVYLTKTPTGGILASSRFWERSIGIDPGGTPEKAAFQLRLNLIKDGKITDITPTGATYKNNSASSLKDGHIVSPYRVLEIPGAPGEYLVGTWFDGMYRFKDGKVTRHYFDDAETTITPWFGNVKTVTDITFDKAGNLYAASESFSGNPRYNLHVLPAGKVKAASTTKADWEGTFLDLVGGGFRDANLVVTSGGILFVNVPFGEHDIAVIDTKNTPGFKDNVVKFFNKIYDQDNKEINVGYIRSIVEDKNGQVWFDAGTNGICVIDNPSEIIRDNIFRVRRIKVPRNDGTNLADYLCDSQEVGCIAVDSSNRKWISTLASGVYLVSEDGTEILEHYTTENSPLPSNRVYSVACDDNSGSVYFGTEFGLVEYNSTSAPANDNYDDVYAYPNPVRPDYSGWITVDGLMDNSLVKIADSAGNVFAQGRSDGGRFVWDGCNAAGERVKTGVYYVYASQGSADSGSSGCVTKILVVN